MGITRHRVILEEHHREMRAIPRESTHIDFAHRSSRNISFIRFESCREIQASWHSFVSSFSLASYSDFRVFFFACTSKLPPGQTQLHTQTQNLLHSTPQRPSSRKQLPPDLLTAGLVFRNLPQFLVLLQQLLLITKRRRIWRHARRTFTLALARRRLPSASGTAYHSHTAPSR